MNMNVPFPVAWFRRTVEELIEEKNKRLRETGIVQEKVIQLNGDVFVREAAQTMHTNDSSSVLVLWQGRYGIFTKDDLCTFDAKFGELDTTPLWKVSTFDNLRKVSLKTMLGELLADFIFDKKGKVNIILHIIVEDGDKVITVLSMKDLDWSFFLAFRKYAELVEHQNQ